MDEERQERQRRLRAEGIARELEGRDDMAPPWLKYPEYDRYSLGWRMGGGEWYMILWGAWVERLSREQLLGYWKKYAPLPVEWLDWVAFSFGYDDLEGRVGERGVFTGVRWLEEQGLADFAAFKAWFQEEWGLDEEGDDVERDLERDPDPGRPGPDLDL